MFEFITHYLASSLLVVGGLWTVAWLVSIKLRNVAIVDSIWGVGFIVSNYWYMYLSEQPSEAASIASMLVLIWGCRLSLHIGKRSRGKPEDFRYGAMRQKDPDGFWWKSLFTVFWLQAFLVVVISLPLASIHSSPMTLTTGPVVWIGVGAWAVGFIFETVGDWQLEQFKSDPSNKGKLLSTGLWSLTRHPNYFGDALQWWGLWIICLDSTYGLLSIASPILMTYFLIKVTGAALLDRSIKKSKPGAEEYFASTPAFFPKLSNLWKSR